MKEIYFILTQLVFVFIFGINFVFIIYIINAHFINFLIKLVLHKK